MLAAHRDQENLVHSHQVPVKQQPKTPGARYPKTPLGLRNDENAPTAFAGKTAIYGGAAKLGGNDRSMAKGTGKGQTMRTPMEARTRAPLGNKTTNAKAKASRSVGVKDIVKEIEKSQAKQATTQKPMRKPVELAPTRLTIQPDKDNGSDDGDEPEYAPPQPTPLPYQSDVLPEGGLTFEGLKKGNFLKGFYEHFHNPVGENGVSREDKAFNEEMQVVLERAEERNKREAAGLDWSIEDIAETVNAIRRRPASVKEPEPCLGKTVIRGAQKHAPTSCSRRAASALAVPLNSLKTTTVARPPPSSSTSAGRPLSALIAGRKPPKPAGMTPASCAGNSAGEAASRTTIGYNKGRTASSMVHSRGGSVVHNRSIQAVRPLGKGARDAEPERAMTPARVHQAVLSKESAAPKQSPRPQFLSIFDDVDDEDLPPMRVPYSDSVSDDEEDDFELKLDL